MSVREYARACMCGRVWLVRGGGVHNCTVSKHPGLCLLSYSSTHIMTGRAVFLGLLLICVTAGRNYYRIDKYRSSFVADLCTLQFIRHLLSIQMLESLAP